jgi:uncharacterized protein (UPF0335 family)
VQVPHRVAQQLLGSSSSSQWRSISRVDRRWLALPWRASWIAWARATRSAMADAGLAVGLGRHRLRRHRRHRHLQVDAVEQGAGNLVLVAQHRILAAAALAGRMAQPAAGAGIHRRDQLKTGRKIGLARRARDRDVAGFERLAQHFQHVAAEFRQLVEEQHAVVGQRNLARTRHPAAADQGHARAGVVRTAEGPAAPALDRKAPGQRLDRRRLQRFLIAQRRQQARKARGQHAFAGARRPHHQEPLIGYYPAIVDRELFETVQATATERAPKVTVKAGLRSILAGLTKCPLCGASMTRVSKGNALKGGKPKLVCTKAKTGAGCQYRSVVLEEVEQALRNHIEPLLAMPPLVDEVAEDEVQRARTSLEVVEDELAKMVHLAASHPMRSVLERLEALEQERDEFRERIADLEGAAIHTNYAAVAYRADNLRRLLKDSPTDTARINAGLRSLFDRVVVDYTTGQLRFVWKSGQESSLMFAWVE